MLNSYTFVLSRIKMKSLYSTINKRKKISALPYTTRKNNIFIKKSQNKQKLLFDLKYAILNRYAYEWKKMEMTNSEVIKNLSKFLLHTLREMKIGTLTKNTKKFTFFT